MDNASPILTLLVGIAPFVGAYFLASLLDAVRARLEAKRARRAYHAMILHNIAQRASSRS